MRVNTKAMGTVEVSDERLITFPQGLFGFEQFKQYALLDSELNPFFWLQSLEKEQLAFILIDPFLVTTDYEVDIDDKSLASIGIENPADVYLLAIVTVPQNGTGATANLQGPIVINRKNRNAMQVVLPEGKWSTKYNLVEALKQKKGE